MLTNSILGLFLGYREFINQLTPCIFVKHPEHEYYKCSETIFLKFLFGNREIQDELINLQPSFLNIGLII